MKRVENLALKPTKGRDQGLYRLIVPVNTKVRRINQYTANRNLGAVLRSVRIITFVMNIVAHNGVETI